MKEIKIPNSEGKSIAAVIHYPEAKTERLSILCPGYLDSKDYEHLITLAEALVGRGYTVVRFNPIGTWTSDGDISEYNNTQYLKDIKSVLEYMLREGNYQHVLLGGHSRGGQVSILYAARDSRISLVVGIMPSSGPVTGQRREEWKRDGFSVSKRNIPGKVETIEFKVPFSHVLDRDKYDVVEDVKKVHVTVIFIAGELDILVPPKDVKEIFDNANEPKKFILIKGIDHEYRHNPPEVQLVNEKIMKALPA